MTFIDWLMVGVGLGGAVFLAHGLRCCVEQIWPAEAPEENAREDVAGQDEASPGAPRKAGVKS